MAYPGSSYKLLFTLVDPVTGAALNGQTFDTPIMRRNGADAAGADIATLGLTVTNIDATFGVYEMTGTIPSGWNYDDEIQPRVSFQVGAAVRAIVGPKEFLRLQNVRKGTAQAGSIATTIKLDAGASATDGVYVGCPIHVCGGTGAGQAPRLITAYNGTSKVATVDRAWVTTPDATSVFTILPAVLFQDAYSLIGTGGAGLTALGDDRLVCLDQRVSIGFKDIAHNDLNDQLSAFLGVAGANLSAAGATLATVIRDLLQATRWIDKTTDPAHWSLVLIKKGTGNLGAGGAIELLRQPLYDVDGANLHTATTPIGRSVA